MMLLLYQVDIILMLSVEPYHASYCWGYYGRTHSFPSKKFRLGQHPSLLLLIQQFSYSFESCTSVLYSCRKNVASALLKQTTERNYCFNCLFATDNRLDSDNPTAPSISRFLFPPLRHFLKAATRTVARDSTRFWPERSCSQMPRKSELLSRLFAVAPFFFSIFRRRSRYSINTCTGRLSMCWFGDTAYRPYYWK